MLKKVIKFSLKLLTRTILGVVLIVALLLGVLTILEYRPLDVDKVKIVNNNENLVNLDETISLMTFNIGYAGLGKDEDFVMDGGKKGRPDSKEVVESYLSGIKDLITSNNADIYLLQEVDLSARRSYYLNEVKDIHEELGSSYNYTFAYNFKALFVPFPVSLTDYIGPVESGIQTLTKYQVDDSSRYQFPGSFDWPLRIANLKRAMMVSYLPINNSDKKLVIINLHMSAYDGDGSLRAQEMAFLKEFLIQEYEKGNYVIVGGDFNQTFPAAVDIYPVNQDLYIAYPIENDFLPTGYTFEIDISNPTCRLLNQPYDKDDENTQYYIIDGFIVSSNIEVEDVNTINHEFLYSDHNPVKLNIKLKP